MTKKPAASDRSAGDAAALSADRFGGEVLLVAQDEHKLTTCRRADGRRPQISAGVEAAAHFRSIGLLLPLYEVYDDNLSA